ncbi:MerR family transcriptional regulator [Nocardia sp. NPDC003482]|uniref:MerR family transcriptional regulator n=1 Tax=Nocardia sp. NPDC004068 TaxID=3364303 RepID=UPI0036C696AD
MITIGQLAAYAGVTIKTIRHYHERGLLPEPERDASGYRRYGAAEAVTLVKIRTLAEAGVPLARVGELLDAGPDEFAAAIDQIDDDLRRRIRELRRSRERVAQLRGGTRLFVSAEVADYLDRLRELGISERTIAAERDGWILMQATAPAEARKWLSDKLIALEDPEFRALYRDHDAAFDWSPDDPRLPELADRTLAWSTRHGTESGPPGDPRLARLAAEAPTASSPAWDRIGALVAARLRSKTG